MRVSFESICILSAIYSNVCSKYQHMSVYSEFCYQCACTWNIKNGIYRYIRSLDWNKRIYSYRNKSCSHIEQNVNYFNVISPVLLQFFFPFFDKIVCKRGKNIIAIIFLFHEYFHMKLNRFLLLFVCRRKLNKMLYKKSIISFFSLFSSAVCGLKYIQKE